MENHEKNIDDLFREELGGYTETPPPAVWDSLQKKLAKTPQGLRWSDRRIWYVAILCLILMLSIPAVRNLTNSAYSGNRTVATNETNKIAPATNDGVSASKNKAADNNTSDNNNKTGDNTDGTSTQQPENTTPKSTGNNTANNITVTTVEKTNKTKGSSIAESKTSRQQQNISGKKGQNKPMPVSKTHSHSKRGSGRNNSSNAFDNAIASSSVPNESTQPDHIYNSSLSRPAPAEEVAGEQAATTSQAKENDANAAAKPQAANNNQATNNKAASKNETKKMPKPTFDRWEAGVKAGYETGFDNDGSKKAVVSPYLQFNLSPKFSIMTQPAIKASSLNTRRIGNANTYYKENADSSVLQNGNPVPIPITLGSGFVDTIFKKNYIYTQTHDSIVKSNSIGGTYFEAELPILLKYRMSKNFSVYGGVNLVYSKSVSISENTAYYKNIQVTDLYSVIGRETAAPPPTSSVITYQGADFSTYHGPQYPTTTTDEWRVGYMLGFSYEFYKRWLFDALIQQSNASPNVQAGYNVNTALSSPYLRFTLGYKLIK